jgi:hypothetical protein
MIPPEIRLHIGSLLFEGVDQIDLTGPFEVLSRIPNSTYRIYGKTAAPVRDLKGLWLTPDAALADAPPLDILHVPGGFGQEALMEDAEVLGWMLCAGAAFQQRHARDWHQRRSWNRRGNPCEPSRRGGRGRHDVWPPNSASPFRPRGANDLVSARPFGENRGRIGAPANGRAPK